MPLRIRELRAPLDIDDDDVIGRALRIAGVSPGEVASVELTKKSIDRRRRVPEFVYTLELHLKDEPTLRARVRTGPSVEFTEAETTPEIPDGDRPLHSRPVVIGAGPAGLFAALTLARRGFRPLVIERGARMNERVRHIEAFYRGRELRPDSNYLFGEGGAGTFSDGKLTCRSKDPRGRFVLDEFRKKSGAESIRYYYRPHLGSDRVRAVVGHLRREIESLGGTFAYGERLDHVLHENGRLLALRTGSGEIGAECAILAPGHSARDLYRNLLADGVRLEQKPFQLGFRVEHPQSFIDDRVWRGAGDLLRLGPADYRLAATIDGRGVFSFCMCPGGEIIPSVHDSEHFSTNGMSWFKRDTGFANSGIVTTIEAADFGSSDVLAGIRMQETFETRAAEMAGKNFSLPAQRLIDFLRGEPTREVPRTSCRSGEIPADVAVLAPDFVTSLVRRALPVFDRQLPGFLHEKAVICGPEARSSSPVRIVRDEDSLEAPAIAGLFPVGEGAGYAGGIVSAAIDGVRAAEKIVARWRPAFV